MKDYKNLLEKPSVAFIFCSLCAFRLTAWFSLSFRKRVHHIDIFISFCICMRFFFCFFIACSLFLLKLSFLSQKALIVISKLHEHGFVFLLYLKKLQFLSPNSMNTGLFSYFISKSFDFCLYPCWCSFHVLPSQPYIHTL